MSKENTGALAPNGNRIGPPEVFDGTPRMPTMTKDKIDIFACSACLSEHSANRNHTGLTIHLYEGERAVICPSTLKRVFIVDKPALRPLDMGEPLPPVTPCPGCEPQSKKGCPGCENPNANRLNNGHKKQPE